MILVRLPTPLRPYASGLKEVEVRGANVRAALDDLVRQHPGLRPHLFDDVGGLRAYVNVFRNDEDVRHQQGLQTQLQEPDRLLIVPSIAGGSPPSMVDYSALRTNQAAVIGLIVAAFVAAAPLVAGLVGLVMVLGSAAGRPGFVWLYRGLRSLRAVRPDTVRDNPEPHLFAQAFGGVVLILSVAVGMAGFPSAGWVLAWVVAALAGLNLFAGFCVGCAIYYWLNRLGIPGFRAGAIPGTVPGRRPPTAG
jgi:molybdopterin converting factor small subunit